jgi:hypothetical protein
MDNPKIKVVLTQSQWSTIGFLLGRALSPSSGVTLHEAGHETVSEFMKQTDDPKNIVVEEKE